MPTSSHRGCHSYRGQARFNCTLHTEAHAHTFPLHDCTKSPCPPPPKVTLSDYTYSNCIRSPPVQSLFPVSSSSSLLTLLATLWLFSFSTVYSSCDSCLAPVGHLFLSPFTFSLSRRICLSPSSALSASLIRLAQRSLYTLSQHTYTHNQVEASQSKPISFGPFCRFYSESSESFSLSLFISFCSH